jgi:hypothetical protein
MGQAVGDQVNRAAIDGFKHIFGDFLFAMVMQLAV